MAKSLIRKNQLSTDIADLVGQYGSGFFISASQTGTFTATLTGANVVYTTGNQTVSGLKNFITRPTVNGSGVLLIGEAAGGGTVLATGANIVYTTGDQMISGVKTFANRINTQEIVAGVGGVLLISGDDFDIKGGNYLAIDSNDSIVLRAQQQIRIVTDSNENNYDDFIGIQINSNTLGGKNIDFRGTGFFWSGIDLKNNKILNASNIIYNTGNQTISGLKTFSTRPEVNGTGVLLSGDKSIVYTTGDQTVSGTKTFANSINILGNFDINNGTYIHFESGQVSFLPSENPFTNKDYDINLMSYPYLNSYISFGYETNRVGESINSQNLERELKIWETGGYFGNTLNKIARFGASGILLAEGYSNRVGIGTLFPQEKVHISGGNLRVDGGASFSNRPTVNGVGVLLVGEAAGGSVSGVVYTTGNQTISGTKTFVSNTVLYSGVNVNFNTDTNVKFSGNVTFSNDRVWETGLVLGTNKYTIPYSGGSFSKVPKIFTNLDVTGSTVFNYNITGRTVNSFGLLFSTTLTENATLMIRATV